MQALDPHKLRALQHYQANVEHDLIAAEKHADQQAAYEKWYGTPEDRRNTTSEFFLIAGVCAVIAGVVGAVLASLGLMNWMLMPTVVLMGGFMCGALVVYARMFISMFRKGNVQPGQLDELVVACPNCGAPGKLTPGDSIDTCAHCHAALVPGSTAIQQGLEAAARARRKAALRHYRTEIKTIASVYGGGSGKHVVFFVLVPFAVMLTLPTLMITAEQLQQGKELPLPPLLILLGVSLGLWGTIGLILWLRWSKQQATARGMAPLERAFNARRGSGTRGLADWILTHWAGPFPIQRLYTGVNHQFMAGNCHGFPFLIDFNPSKAQHMVTRATLHVAAEIPGVKPLDIDHQAALTILGAPLPQGNQTASDLRFGLERAGFELRVSEAGLSVSAEGERLKQLRKHPELLAEWTSVVTGCVALVTALGGRPG
ncbi:MAG: hypothetical protein H6718_10285 [Polyangiaceae bacterium]|nr:hypothetical protein [Myxococcales bacterium]MCB9585779.1 hypothetical protein [Polyangiaceae bacterium]